MAKKFREFDDEIVMDEDAQNRAEEVLTTYKFRRARESSF